MPLNLKMEHFKYHVNVDVLIKLMYTRTPIVLIALHAHIFEPYSSVLAVPLWSLPT